MIIKNNISKKTKTQSSKTSAVLKSGSIIKKEDLNFDIDKSQKQSDENINNKKQNEIKEQTLDDFEKIDISLIEFKERAERRRGDRRRGYRRIDERSLVTRAQQEAHSIKELAAREGYQNGLQQAQNEIEEIKESISEFLSLKDKMYEDFYPHIMELALEITKKIIKKETELSQDILKNVVLNAMEQLNSDVQKVEIKVNSSDLEFARVSLPEIIEANNKGIKISFSSDDTVEQGSCILIANNGVIDANFKTQLIVLQNAFGIYQGGI